MRHSHHRGPRFTAIICAAVLATAAPEARGQGTAVVAASNPIYNDIERLSELGMLDSVIIGQRPYSIREIARITSAADARVQRGEASTSSIR